MSEQEETRRREHCEQVLKTIRNCSHRLRGTDGSTTGSTRSHHDSNADLNQATHVGAPFDTDADAEENIDNVVEATASNVGSHGNSSNATNRGEDSELQAVISSAANATDPTPGSLVAVKSMTGPVANLCSATLGAGILSIPYSLYQSGLVVGMTFLLLSACATIVSIDMIVESCKILKSNTYEQLVGCGLGPRARTMTEVAILVFCEGVCVAYLIAVGDILGLLFGQQYRTMGMILSWICTILPLSLLRTMESLQWASSIGIISILSLLVAALQHAIQDRNDETHDFSSILWPSGGITSVVCALPMILFAFSCQVNVCAIYGELPHKNTMKCITRAAVALCTLLYSCIACVSLFDFGTSIQGNILLNYDVHKSSWLVHAAFGSMAMAVITAFPLNVFPSRTTLEGIWDNNNNLGESDEEEDHLNDALDDLRQPLLASEGDAASDISLASRGNQLRHVGFTLLIAGSALCLALVVPNISLVFGLIGGTVSSLLGFILPGALSIVTGNRCVGWIMVVCGTIVGVLTTTITILTM